MTIKSAGEIFVAEIQKASELLKKCVTPIFDANQSGEAELLGSAVILSISSSTFLCTAKHVIDGNANSSLYFDGLSELELLEGDFFVSEEHDIAVLKLSKEQIEKLGKYEPLQLHQIANRSEALSSKYVQFIGFPETQNRKIYQQNKIKGRLHSNGCTIIEITDTRVRILFSRKRMMDSNSRQRVKAPDPHGMSGGAMIGVEMNEETLKGNPQPKLIGISTDNPSPNEVFGTTISMVLAIIRDGWQVSLPPRLDPS